MVAGMAGGLDDGFRQVQRMFPTRCSVCPRCDIPEGERRSVCRWKGGRIPAAERGFSGSEMVGEDVVLGDGGGFDGHGG